MKNLASIERQQFKATYIRVAELCGLKTDNREEAKKFLQDFANERGLTMQDLFEGYNETLEASISQRALDGFYDY